MASIMDIPVEVSQRVLANCRPQDVAAFSQLCRAAYNLIYLPSDRYLWLELYLSYPLDHPDIVERRRVERNISGKPDLNNLSGFELRLRLIDVIRAERAAGSKGPLTEEEELQAVRIFQAFAQELPVAEVSDQGQAISHNGEWLERTLEHSPLLFIEKLASTAQDRTGLERMKAHLRCYLRSSFKEKDNTESLETRVSTVKRNKSRCFVYNLRNYTAKTRWGPFTPDNRVNWVHAEHLMNVVWMNLCELALPNALRPRIGMEATRPHSAAGNPQDGDWAGVEGTWTRSVCFMDHRDLFAFNTHHDIPNSLNEDIFQDASFMEATRILEVKLKVVEEYSLRGLDFRAPKYPATNPHHPPLYFKGASRGPGGVDSMIKGCVYEEEDRSIRWRFVREAIHDFSPQWSSSGVQIGGVGSAIGVIGVWTTTEHDDGDPVGPFWLWKNEEGMPTQVMDFA